MAHKFDPEKIERLLSEERVREIAPEEALRTAGLMEGDIFADIGSGPGFFSLPASRIVGDYGIVFAIDTQEEMLLYIRDHNPPQNIVLLKSEENSIPLADQEADFALLAYMLHEAEDKVFFLEEVKRILREGGILFVIDWVKQEEEKGPPVHERLTQDESISLLRQAGFRDFKTSRLNPSHYAITAKR